MSRWAALYGDARFLLASWPARAVYQQLLDGADAAGDWRAPPGRDAVLAVAVAVRVDGTEARAILEELTVSGLLTVEPDRVRLLVCSGRGPRGGKTVAERVRDHRREHAKPAPDVTAPNGAVTPASVANLAANTEDAATRAADVTDVQHVGVTGSTVTSPSPSPPSLSPVLSLPLGSPSLSPTPFPPAPPPPLAPGSPPVAAGSNGEQLGLLGADERATTKPPKGRRRKVADERALPFTVADVMHALAVGSAGRVIESPFDSRLAPPITLVIRNLGDGVALADVELVGKAFAAGALGREEVSANWAAQTGRLATAIGVARRWRDGAPLDGRHGPVGGGARASPKAVRTEAPAPASAYAAATAAGRAIGYDPLRGRPREPGEGGDG